MDYKKLYEKAVERAKTLTNSGFNDFDFVKHIFPELAESEDEKIRKALIDYFNDFTLPTFEGLEPKKILAWLEKQGEKLPVGFYYVNSEGKKFYSDTFKYGDVILHVEKQSEQKPAEVRTTGYWHVEDVEQKPADMSIKEKAHQIAWETSKHYDPLLSKESWCEMAALDMASWLEKQVFVDEDEIVKGIRRGVAISLINHIDANSKGMCLSNMECEDIENAIVDEDWDKVYGYMKKKLEKQGEQKPAWSEEDKEMLEDTCRILSNSKECTTSNVRWLKSLRPQSHWKPSDEHYELEEFAKIVRGNLTGISKAVQELFEAKYLQLTGNKMYGGYKD